jgi:hypothetical protein
VSRPGGGWAGKCRDEPPSAMNCIISARRHTLSRRRIIPLPQWKANPETDPEALFQKEQLVLALYPQTTCFYRALIHTPPQRVSSLCSKFLHDTTLKGRSRPQEPSCRPGLSLTQASQGTSPTVVLHMGVGRESI